ncbi:MAG: menaquinol oxidoreductase [Deltaproteobacteria bacterium]|nr:menaquinol oxidoreductase [Deltaproteobacteria bacterium]
MGPADRTQAGSQAQGDTDRLRRDSQARIRRLRSRGNWGIWGLCTFLVVSLAARRDFSFLPPLSERTRDLLGASPPVNLINMALVAYSFSALILTLSRMMSGADTYRGLSHLGYLTAFYVFYHFADAMSDNFWAVFAAGVTILVLEGYGLRTRCGELIEEEQERIALRETRDRFGP